LKKAKLDMRDKRSGVYILHMHTSRKWMRTRLPGSIQGVMAEDGYPINGDTVTEKMLGHQKGQDPAYLRLTDQDLARAYLAGMGALSVYEVPADISGVQEELKSEKDRVSTLETTVARLEAQLANQNIAELGKSFKEIIEALKKSNGNDKS
jgi:hypothetical protein